ncbi:hypothetical protein [Mesorhizobium sp.]|uniref:hypothetical protein n=1 Tax=Mesorhizobium sp. TaxID=1871066 RepID=UPI00120E2A4B|nr:hypothetical protein [Mesorhizobium sp.]TIM41642.1 MAG: hypothetical protein E5Y56_22250 [Mesorhizobium sp.]
MTNTEKAARNLVRLRRMEGQLVRLCNDAMPENGNAGYRTWASMSRALDHIGRAIENALSELPAALGRDERAGVKAAPVAPAAPAEGWKPHPTAPGYFYKGQEVLLEADLRAKMGAHPARRADIPGWAH